MAEVCEGVHHGVGAHEKAPRHGVVLLTLIEGDRRGVTGDVSPGGSQESAWRAATADVDLIVAAYA